MLSAEFGKGKFGNCKFDNWIRDLSESVTVSESVKDTILTRNPWEPDISAEITEPKGNANITDPQGVGRMKDDRGEGTILGR